MLKKNLFRGFSIIILLILIVVVGRQTNGYYNKPIITDEPYKTKGLSDAPIELLVFSDYACPFCSKLETLLDEILAAFPKQIKIQFKHFPLRSHPKAFVAAEAAECAADQNQFWNYHELLFSNQTEWTDSTELRNILLTYASKLKMNESEFGTCLDSGRKKEIVLNNKKEGEKLFINSTPTLILNRHKVLMLKKKEAIETQIQKELERIKV